MKTETLLLLFAAGAAVYFLTRPSPLSGVNDLESPPTLLPALNPMSPSYNPTMAYQYLNSFPKPVAQ